MNVVQYYRRKTVVESGYMKREEKQLIKFLQNKNFLNVPRGTEMQ
jgi:hypothetical protein